MKIQAQTSFSLKDQLFNKDTVAVLAKRVHHAYPKFRQQVFSRKVLAEFPKLELKARIDHMAAELTKHLPRDFETQVALLHNALPEPLDPNKTDDDFGSFIWAVPSTLIAANGCNAKQLPLSLEFLEAATQRFSAEFALRPFLAEFPDQTLAYVQRWVDHDNYHVRRLASEGIRPYLPWAQRVLLPPTAIVEVLTKLHTDKTRFVTRSVANNLNDLSKQHPDLVIRTLKNWQTNTTQHQAEFNWIANHALRTLTKQDHAQALALLGYPTKPKFTLGKIGCSAEVKIGEALVWEGRLTSKADQKLRVNLRVHFLKSNESHSAKVFAVKDLMLKKNQVLDIKKTLPIKPMTTRALFPGKHFVELTVNGVSRGKQEFLLRA